MSLGLKGLKVHVGSSQKELSLESAVRGEEEEEGLNSSHLPKVAILKLQLSHLTKAL